MSVVACPSPAPQPVYGVVVFDAGVFARQFPEFRTVDPAALSFNFQRATLLLNNSCGSRIQDANTREALLTLLTAHITAITNGVNGQPPPGVVGRISAASEGTVSVATDNGPTTMAAAYFTQTKYGAEFWAATAPYRAGLYFAPAPSIYGLPFGGPGFESSEPYGPVGFGNNGMPWY